MALILTVILVALIFEYINGFHDTANSIATVVSTKVLPPRQAILLAAITNLWGALAGTAVAKTVSSGLVESKYVSSEILIAALLGAIVWESRDVVVRHPVEFFAGTRRRTMRCGACRS